jgi:thioredoxin-related protein
MANMKEAIKRFIPDSPKKALIELTALAGIYGFLASPLVAENKPKNVVCKDGVCWIETTKKENIKEGKLSKKEINEYLNYKIPLKKIKNNNLNEVLESTGTSVLIAGTERCIYCKKLVKDTIVPNMQTYKNIRLFYMDGQENKEISEKYGFRGWPTVMVFRHKKLIDAFLSGKNTFQNRINKYLSNEPIEINLEMTKNALQAIRGGEDLESKKRIEDIIKKNSFNKINIIKGLFSYDLDTLNPVDRPDENGDICWSHETETERYLIPVYNAEITNFGIIDFDKINLKDLQTAKYNKEKINGSDDNNQLTKGTVLGIKTNKGNYIKIRIDGYLEQPKAKIKNYDIKCMVIPYFSVEKSKIK